MGSFYTVPSAVRIVFAMLALLAFLVQTASLLALLARLDGEKRFFRKTFEGMLTLHLALLAFLLVSFHDQSFQGSAALTAHMAIRWEGVLTACAGAGSALVEKQPRRTLAILSAVFTAATLPVLEPLLGSGFAWLFLAAVLFFFLRAVDGALFSWRCLKHNLSRLSIKEAMDTLHGGILFAAAGGNIVLQNRSMFALLHRILCKPVSNADKCWEQLYSFSSGEEITITPLGQKLLVRLPDATWEFSKETIAAGNRAYTLICAADVTETDRITQELAAVTAQLEHTANQLQYMLDHYEEVKNAREAVAIKRRIHDGLGQRISILNRALLEASDDGRVFVEIIPLLSDLMKEIRNHSADCPDTVLCNLERSFALAGAKLIVEGALPENDNRALLLLSVVREAATNAVRHAAATQIHVQMVQTQVGCTMVVTNDGSPPTDPLVEGGGILGMRERLAQAGGSLTVETVPVFRLCVNLPD